MCRALMQGINQTKVKSNQTVFRTSQVLLLSRHVCRLSSPDFAATPYSVQTPEERRNDNPFASRIARCHPGRVTRIRQAILVELVDLGSC